MRKLISCGVLLALLVGCSSIIGVFLRDEKANATPGVAQRWEYLVIAHGKVYFTTDLVKAEAFTYKDASLHESVETENVLDEAGAMGWELVDVVGVIGGDQEFIFKRPVP